MNKTLTMDTFSKIIKFTLEAFFSKKVKVDVRKVTKNNNSVLTGLTIIDNSSNLAPTIYLESYFEDYKRGESISDICQRILKTYKNNKATDDFDVSIVTNFNHAKDNICCKLINAEHNAELLADAPHIIIEDLAVIFYILAMNNESGIGTITVRNNIFEMWNITLEQLYDLALDNTMKINKEEILTHSDIMKELFKNNLLDEDFVLNEIINDFPMQMFVVTNKSSLNGAITLFYDGLMKKFSKMVGGSFYILPSSIHEVLFIPCVNNHMSVDDFRDMVRSINKTEISKEDFLSDNIYYYNASTDNFTII
jgi:hypothetical protein